MAQKTLLVRVPEKVAKDCEKAVTEGHYLNVSARALH